MYFYVFRYSLAVIWIISTMTTTSISESDKSFDCQLNGDMNAC